MSDFWKQAKDTLKDGLSTVVDAEIKDRYTVNDPGAQYANNQDKGNLQQQGSASGFSLTKAQMLMAAGALALVTVAVLAVRR